MLSVAYGGDQRDSMQVHKPEVCYQAQGFDVLKVVASKLTTDYGKIPIKRLVATQGNRNEPITYWFTVGKKAISNGLDFKLNQMRYGLTGKIPDGLLFRVSSIGNDENLAYLIQDKFVFDLLMVVNPKDRLRLIGVM
jgi:EpsI family protein